MARGARLATLHGVQEGFWCAAISVSRRAVRGAVYQHGRVLSGRDPSSQI